MADQLFLRLEDASEACSWVVVDAGGRLLQGLRRGSLDDAVAAAAGRRVVLLVPGLEVVTAKAELPSASSGRLRQMLPYALEDTFADDVDALAFAIGPKLASGAYQASVVAKRSLEAWLARLTEAGIAAQAVYADSDGVPNTPSTLTVVVDEDVAYGRRPGEPALAVQGLTLPQAIAVFTAVPEGQPAVQHALVYVDAATKERHEAELAAVASGLSSLDVKLMHDGPLPAFAAKLANDPGTNLLQGRYAPRSDWGRALNNWRLAASLLAVLLGTALIGNVVDYWSLRNQDAALTDVVTTLCRERLATDRLTQCQTELNALLQAAGQSTGGGETFLSTLATIAAVTTPAIRFENTSYRNRVLNAQLRAPNVTALSELEKSIDETGRFEMSIQSTNPQAEGDVDARIQIVGVTP